MPSVTYEYENNSEMETAIITRNQHRRSYLALKEFGRYLDQLAVNGSVSVQNLQIAFNRALEKNSVEEHEGAILVCLFLFIPVPILWSWNKFMAGVLEFPAITYGESIALMFLLMAIKPINHTSK